MAHPEQQEFFNRLKLFFASKFMSAEHIFEVGSQDINGSVRTLFPGSAEYVGVDLGPAKCVDWVIPGELVELSNGWADIVISTECFEHCKNWDRVFLNMVRILGPGGLFIFTSAGTGRAAHGTIDSDQYSSPFTTSYYKNLDVDQVVERIKLGSFFSTHGFEVNSTAGDLYFWGIRSNTSFEEIEQHWSTPLDRLARAQGQLAQAATRYKDISTEASQAIQEAEQARLEASKAIQEGEQARLEASKAIQEAEQARLEASQTKQEADQAGFEASNARQKAEQAQLEATQARQEADQARLVAISAREEANRFESQVIELHQSRIWRFTRPLREIKDRITTIRTSKHLNRLNIHAPQQFASPTSLEITSPIPQEVASPYSQETSSPDYDQIRIEQEVKEIARSGLFDGDYYLAMYPDIDPISVDPIRHYCEHGWKEGRNPSDDFDTNGYIDAYSDIRNAGLNPFWHYVVAGASESRQSNPKAKSCFEGNAYFGNISCDLKMIAYYKIPNWNLLLEKNTQNHRLPTPHDDLGFYKTSGVETLIKQAQLAIGHGIYAWCFEINPSAPPSSEFSLPLILANPRISIGIVIDINVCSSNDLDLESIKKTIIESASDHRYLRIVRRPVFIISFPGSVETYTHYLKQLDSLIYETFGIRPYLIARPTKSPPTLTAASNSYFDTVLDYPLDSVPAKGTRHANFTKEGKNFIPYSVVVSQAIAIHAESDFPRFQCISLGCEDISLRYSNFTTLEFRRFLDAVITDVRKNYPADRRLIFLNSWNDWSRGATLEPDRISGYIKLNELSRSIIGMPSGLPLPKVTVIVPNYNHSAFLPRRLDSIFSQTYQNIEVILLDDASEDGSQELLCQYANQYPSISKTIFNDLNSGRVFRQWAKGIHAATGDLIWIAESDDYCDLDFLEKLVRCFDDESVMLAYAQSIFVNADETVMPNEFEVYVRDLACRSKWNTSYTNTAHQEVSESLGIINTIPNVSAVVFRRPVDMPLLNDEAWLSMRVVGDWIFYLHQLRGGSIAYTTETHNYFRRYKGSTAETFYQKQDFYRELSEAAMLVAQLYAVPESATQHSLSKFKEYYDRHVGCSESQFREWVDVKSILDARETRTPNIVISTQGFYPGGAEILPIRMANEFKRQGHSVMLLSGGHGKSEYIIRNMLRRDIPVVVNSDVCETRQIIEDYGLEVLNSHQWHVQKYPCAVSDVFDGLKAHIASMHGMIEHGEAFEVTLSQLKVADQNVSTWVYTADKNIEPFIHHGLYSTESPRFIKLPNGMEAPLVDPINRLEIGIPDNAFVLCCVSRAIPDKGWLETIDAVTLARKISGRDIRLILVGNGPVYDELIRTSLPPFIYLAGFNENSVGFYAAAQAGIMLTKFKSESFPLTIVDCLFAQRPFIATSVGEIRNILSTDSGLAGEVVELEDWEIPVSQVALSIISLASDSEVYQSAKDRACDAAKKYAIDHVAKQYLELFYRDIKLKRSSSL